MLNLVRDKNGIEGLSKYLIEKAKTKKKYNIDNITLIIVDIQKLRSHQ